MAFGNVNVDYKPCKSVGQLKSAALYMLGKKPEQIRDGIRKTESSLYTALGCNRDNFANNILVTRKLNGKSYSRLKPNTVLAHKMSISFHPKDNPDYQTAFNIAKEFAENFIYSKGYEVLFAIHTDREHIHAHFLISNCNIETGKSYRRSQRDLYEMSEFFGQQCLEYGFVNSVRENFYNHDLERQRDKETFAEKQMKSRGAETFKLFGQLVDLLLCVFVFGSKLFNFAFKLSKRMNVVTINNRKLRRQSIQVKIIWQDVG